MSIVPACRLSTGELSLLGNNVAAPARRSSRRRRQVHAVNRSLSRLGEQVRSLYPRRLPALAFVAS
jgi:hypothetical protein